MEEQTKLRIKRIAPLLIAGTALVAGSGWLAYESMRRASYGISDFGDTSQSADQDEVNTIYDGLYNAIEEALEDAKHQGKSLKVICAEDHEHNDTLLIQLMIQDIAQRLGITTNIFEVDETSLRDSILNNAIRTSNEAVAESEAQYTQNSVWLGAFAIYMQKIYGNAQEMQRQKLPIRYPLVTIAQHRNINALAGDPHYTKIQNYDLTSPEAISREHEMLATLNNTQSDAVGFYGSSHVVVLYEALDRQKHQPLIFDTRNCQIQGPFGAERQRRQDFLNSSPEVRKIVVQGTEVTLAEALIFSTRASIEHRFSHGEISSDEYKKNIHVLDGALEFVSHGKIRQDFSSRNR